MIKKLSPICLILMTAAVAARADAIPIEPGLWEMTSTMNMPMMPQPQVNTMTECIDKNELSVEEVGRGNMDPECQFETGKVNGGTMTWSFECPLEGGGQSHGQWEATSYGDRVEGGGKVTMEVQGQVMEMNISWSGKRIGDCP